MRGYNVIVVYNENADKILMCKRKKDPYKGLANFVGGKIEKNENGLDAAYRELEEETTITSLSAFSISFKALLKSSPSIASLKFDGDLSRRTTTNLFGDIRISFLNLCHCPS